MDLEPHAPSTFPPPPHPRASKLPHPPPHTSARRPLTLPHPCQPPDPICTLPPPWKRAGSGGQQPAVPRCDYAPPLSGGMTSPVPRRGRRCDREAGAERTGLVPVPADLFNPTLPASFHGGGLEGRGRGSRPSPSLPAPGSCPRSHLTRVQVACRREGRASLCTWRQPPGTRSPELPGSRRPLL